jgi:hypothetical protein
LKRNKKKNKLKISNNKLYLLIAIVVSLFAFYIIEKRAEKKFLLNTNSFKTLGVIEKLKENSRKGKSGREDVIYFYFIKNDTIYHKIESTNKGFIKKENIKEGNVFELHVVKNDFGYFKMNFENKIDTLIVKNNNQFEVFNTFIHRNIIN